MNYFKQWYYWQVNGGNDLSKPFLFRVVNANGTELAQATGGFQSEQFWISPTSSGSSATPVTSSLSSTSLSSATPPPTAVNGVTPSNKASFTAKSKSTGKTGSGLSVGAEVGIGVGIGVGVTALLLVGAFFLWRRHQKKKAERDAPPQDASQRPPYGSPPAMSYAQSGSYRTASSDAHHSSYGIWPSPGPQQPPMAYAHETQQPTMAYAHEMPQPSGMRSPVELPGTRGSVAHELHGEHYAPDGRKSPPPRQAIQPWDGRMASDYE